MFDYTFQWRSALRALPDMLAGALVMSVLQIAFGFGIKTTLATKGIPSILHLGPRLIGTPPSPPAGSPTIDAVSPP